MKKFIQILLCFLLTPITSIVLAEPVKVVYHINEDIPSALQALGNIRNHLRADPEVKIVVVGQGAGIDFLLKSAKTSDGKSVYPLVTNLTQQGVIFEVCKNSLNFRNLSDDAVIPEAKIVPAGVAEIARLQAKEGYAYIKP